MHIPHRSQAAGIAEIQQQLLEDKMDRLQQENEQVEFVYIIGLGQWHASGWVGGWVAFDCGWGVCWVGGLLMACLDGP